MLRLLDFWLDIGVDGMRLDAVPYLYEREGTSCENLPETHSALKALRRHVDRKFESRVLLAEANQWPEGRGGVLRGRGREPHGLPLPAHATDVHGPAHGGRYPIVDILSQTPAIPETCQRALALLQQAHPVGTRHGVRTELGFGSFAPWRRSADQSTALITRTTIATTRKTMRKSLTQAS
jgi:hypothetical protein